MNGLEGIPHGAPVSPLFAVQETPSAGRAVFATLDIAKGTPLWVADTPSANVILREYRRELCAQCFTYNRGREWKIRDNSVGFAFCSISCRQQWMDALGEEGVQAWKAVEKLNKGCSRKREMVDASKYRSPSVTTLSFHPVFQPSLRRSLRTKQRKRIGSKKACWDLHCAETCPRVER